MKFKMSGKMDQIKPSLFSFFRFLSISFVTSISFRKSCRSGDANYDTIYLSTHPPTHQSVNPLTRTPKLGQKMCVSYRITVVNTGVSFLLLFL